MRMIIMLLVNLNGKEVELVKGIYINGRLAIKIIDTNSKEALADLTVNIPHAMFYNEEINEALINRIDGLDYQDLLLWLDDNNLTYENAFVGEVKSGFNIYIGVKFKEDALNKMELI